MSNPQKQIKILKEILYKYNISQSIYSLGAYSEDCVCMEQNSCEWEVYVGQRGNKHSLTNHSTLFSACKKVIERIADSESEQIEMLREFDRRVGTQNTLDDRISAVKQPSKHCNIQQMKREEAR